MREVARAPEQVTLTSGAKMSKHLAMELALTALYKLALASKSERRIDSWRNAILMAEVVMPELKNMYPKNGRES